MTTEPEATQNTPDVSIKSDATDETKSFWLKNALARLRSVGDSTRARLHMRFPNIECLEETSIRQHIQNRDIRDNGETQIGESEEAKIRALWGVELYGPSEIESLYSSLRRLGWDRDRLRQQNNSPENWIAQQRMYGSFGNLNLGNIQRQGDSRRFLVDRFAPMPDSVDYMHGYVYQASPSLTAIILCFILKSEHTGELETILQKDRKTRNERGWRSRGYRII